MNPIKSFCTVWFGISIFCCGTSGQGNIHFDNFTIDAPIFGPDGTGLGPEARVQLFLDGVWYGEPESFAAQSPGYFFAGIIKTKQLLIGSEQVFRVRAWIGDSWDSAETRGEVLSGPVLITAGGPPPDIVPFESFTIPEPSIIALACSGLGFLLFWRKRRVCWKL